jgi:hypothetical protein
MSFRTIAASAGMLAAFTFATTAIAPAEPAGSKSSATSTRVAKPLHRAAKPQREASKARHGKRTRVARNRHRPAAEARAQAVRLPTAFARAESAGAMRQQTAAARRFGQFLNPQSFALAANEEMRSPRLLAAHFSGEIADPEIVLAEATDSVAPDARTGMPPIVAHDQTAADESKSSAPAPAHNDPVQVRRAAPTEKEPDRMSFLRWFFIAWGGVLTFASAVRMAVG